MSIRHPVSFAASLAFCPSLPIASESCRSGTTTEAVLSSSLMLTFSTCAGLRAFATKRAGSGSHWITSIRSPFSSLTMFWIRMPRRPTHDPTGSIPSCRAETATLLRKPASRAIDLISTTPRYISGTSSSNNRRSRFLCVRDRMSCGPLIERCTSSRYSFRRWPGR